MAQDLERFIEAHAQHFHLAMNEIRSGKKRSHWMWFIFPQLKGLGFSDTAKYYSLKNLKEAEAFLDHPVLGKNLVAIASALLKLEENNATSVFGKPDDMKLHSSISLFSLVPGADPVFRKLLDKFFEGNQDHQTIALLEK